MKKQLVLALFLALSLCTQAQEQPDWQRLFAELSTQKIWSSGLVARHL